ncbi:MAG: AmpG family muropeptide MFS transporter [Endozoicomonas sp.]
MAAPNSLPRDWRTTLAVYLHRRVITLFFLGFSSGLPILLVFSSLSFWLREADVSRSTIGFFSWVGLAYGFKWVWSPLVDRMPLPLISHLLGRRRAWLLLSQVAITGSLIGMALTDPVNNLWTMALFAVMVAFASATQDIVVDAYRIESAEKDLQAALVASYMVGYRLAMILATAGVLTIAAWFTIHEGTYEQYPWTMAYLIMAGCMGIGIITTLVIGEPKAPVKPPLEQRAIEWMDRNAHLPAPVVRFSGWFYGAMICPFLDFLVRYRWHALLILALIGSYRICDVVMGIMANPFYVDLGYTKQEVAAISKLYGVIMTLVGAAVGGGLMVRYGVMKILFLGGFLAAVTNLLFAFLAGIGHDLTWLTLVISMDNLAGGVATAAFIAYLSSLTNVSYSATQYALFSSVMALLPKFLAGFSGVMVDSVGYSTFFTLTAAMGIPSLLLILVAWKYVPASKEKQPDEEEVTGENTVV